MEYRVEFGGGMGDVFNRMTMDEAYPNLMNMTDEDTCEILLVCHNPFIKEMFDWHPKKSQLDVKWFGYWGPENERENKIKFNLSLDGPINPPGPKGVPKFYPCQEDIKLLEDIKEFSKGRKLIVVQATAGCSDRDIPEPQMKKMLADLETRNCVVVGVGRNYQRSDRYGEFKYDDYPEVLSMVDRLSIPGTVELIRQASGVIACHSCVCLMAWNFRIPNILTLPRAINHINGIDRGEKNQWTFGLFQPETRLVYSEDYSMSKMDEFLDLAKEIQ